MFVNQCKLVYINMSREACPPEVFLWKPIAAVFEQYRKHASRALGIKKKLLMVYSDNVINYGLIEAFRAKMA